MNLDQYERDDPTFKQDLLNSQAIVQIAAKWLKRRGYPVKIQPVRVRPDVHQMREYADNGDIEIGMRIEVKHRPKLHFASPDTFPFSTVIVDVCHTWDNANPKPYAYLIFNADCTGFLIVERRTYTSWIKTSKFDKAKNRQRNFYECPIGQCQYVAIDKGL